MAAANASCSGESDVDRLIIKACELGDLDAIKQFAAADMCRMADKGIRWACGRGHLDLVTWLLGNCRVSTTDDAIGTLQRAACYYGHLHIAEYLADRYGVTELTPGQYDNSFMYMLESAGRPDVVEWLVDRYRVTDHDMYQYYGQPAVRVARQLKRYHVVRWLICRYPKLSTRDHEIQLLRAAYKRGDICQIRTLLDDHSLNGDHLKSMEGPDSIINTCFFARDAPNWKLLQWTAQYMMVRDQKYLSE